MRTNSQKRCVPLPAVDKLVTNIPVAVMKEKNSLQHSVYIIYLYIYIMSLRAEKELNLNPGLADLVLHFIVLQKSIWDNQN